MTVYLHADDLGLHPAVDRAIFRAYEAGAVRAASILATGPTFDAAARQARLLGLPLSLHLAIVDTEPLSPPGEVPSLLAGAGRFPAYFGPVVRRSIFRQLRQHEVTLEVQRQLDRFAEADLVGKHGLSLDGHQHLHLLPQVMRAVLALAPAYRLTRLRMPTLSPYERRQARPRTLSFLLAEALGRASRDRARQAGVAFVPCWGVLFAGSLTLDRARSLLRSLPERAAGQLICHPGDDNQALGRERAWGYDWEAELDTALSLAADRGHSNVKQA
jgi:predicted glycoside hydrolase/deacetylase ChbG (UPF0249 family)